MKQIEALNPGHSMANIFIAAAAENEAIWALAAADVENRKTARLHVRTCQIRSTNLDLSYAEANERARIQLAGEAQGSA